MRGVARRAVALLVVVGAAGAAADAAETITPVELKEAYHAPAEVLAEVQRLNEAGRTVAVQAIVKGTTKIAAGNSALPTPGSELSAEMNALAVQFDQAMRGETFFDVANSEYAQPGSASALAETRHRKAHFVAACGALAAQARARADQKSEV